MIAPVIERKGWLEYGYRLCMWDNFFIILPNMKRCNYILRIFISQNGGLFMDLNSVPETRELCFTIGCCHARSQRKKDAYGFFAQKRKEKKQSGQKYFLRIFSVLFYSALLGVEKGLSHKLSPSLPSTAN